MQPASALEGFATVAARLTMLPHRSGFPANFAATTIMDTPAFSLVL
jgi:hypothetical protein